MKTTRPRYPTLLVADDYLLYRYTNKKGGSWDLATLEDFDEWTDTPEEQCRNGHVYLEAPAEDGGYTGRYTIAADGDIVITDDIYENSASVRTYASVDPNGGPDWGVPDATSDNQLGLVPDRWLYVYKLDSKKGGNQNGIKSTLENLLLNVAVLAKDKCLALQDYSSTPAFGRHQGGRSACPELKMSLDGQEFRIQRGLRHRLRRSL